ncbi:MAG TPA: HRDC domain-containing protein [Desulfobacteraceae bacterium]|nr:HRDC domain-containing protein [Desulfobacteraceae bacterium]
MNFLTMPVLNYTNEYTLIEDCSGLQKIIADIKNEPAIGVDLEADSMFHYQERVCLLQISSRENNMVIDPLSVKDLSPLAPVFEDTAVRKIFHGADYDIRSLFRDFGIEVNNLFDTQIAAKFLGYNETGLASLLKMKFNIPRDKKYQKRDWSQRPLPGDMLQYAADDTSLLIPLHDILTKELEEKGFLFCVEEESEILSRVRPNLSKPGPLFPGFKGAGRLDPRTLAVLEKLLRFRDRMARQRDCPHFKVLGNIPILEIAKSKPITKNDLAGITGLNPRLIERMGSYLINSVKEGLEIPENALPVYPKSPRIRLGHKESARIKALKILGARLAQGLGIDPSLVCTNAQIQALAIANPKSPEDMKDIPEIRKWQVKLFGEDICEVLQETG